jgi:hypothetical protein
MSPQRWHTIILAYRLEDERGDGPFLYNGHKVILPECYYGAYLNPESLKEFKYSPLKYNLYEYALGKNAVVYDTGEVLFRDDDVISKPQIRRKGS